MDKRTVLALFLALLLLALLPVSSFSLEKLKLGTAVKVYPPYYLPILAAEQKGVWKQQDLDVEWVPFGGGALMVRAMAAAAINVGFNPSITHVESVGKGVPVVAVAELYAGKTENFVWVKTDSRFREGKDLKGARVGVMAMAGLAYAFGTMVQKNLAMEKDIKLVATGGIPEAQAMLRTGAIDAVVLGLEVMLKLKETGEIRDVVRVHDFLPSEWTDHLIVARKEYVKTNPETVRKVIKGLFQGIRLVQENPGWTGETIKSVSGVGDAGARMVQERFRFSKDGRVPRKAVENVRSFVLDYGLAPREKMPPAEELYTEEFTR